MELIHGILQTVYLIGSYAFLYNVSHWFFRRRLYKSFEIKNVGIQRLFSMTFTISVSLLQLMLFELLDLFLPSVRFAIWKINVVLMIMLTYIIIPSLIIWTVSLLFNVRRVARTILVVLTLPPLWYGFYKTGDVLFFEDFKYSQSHLFSRMIVCGALIISLIEGFSCVIFPAEILMFYLSREQDASEVPIYEKKIVSLLEMISKKKIEKLTILNENPRRSGGERRLLSQWRKKATSNLYERLASVRKRLDFDDVDKVEKKMMAAKIVINKDGSAKVEIGEESANLADNNEQTISGLLLGDMLGGVEEANVSLKEDFHEAIEKNDTHLIKNLYDHVCQTQGESGEMGEMGELGEGDETGTSASRQSEANSPNNQMLLPPEKEENAPSSSKSKKKKKKRPSLLESVRYSVTSLFAPAVKAAETESLVSAEDRAESVNSLINEDKKRRISLLDDEIVSLESSSRDILLVLANLIELRTKIEKSKQFYGKLRNLISIFTATLCIYRVILTCFNLLFVRETRRVDPLTGFLLKSSRFLNFNMNKYLPYLPGVSAVIIAYMITANVRNYVDRILSVFRLFATANTSNIYALIMCELMAIYFCSSQLMLRTYIPEHYRSRIQFLMQINVNFDAYHHTANKIFVFASTIALLYLMYSRWSRIDKKKLLTSIST